MAFSTHVLSSLRRAHCAKVSGLASLGSSTFSHSSLRNCATLQRQVFLSSQSVFQAQSLQKYRELIQGGKPEDGDKGKENDSDNGKNQQDGSENQPPQAGARDLMFVVGIFLAFYLTQVGTAKEITFKVFVDTFLSRGEVTSVLVTGHNAYIVLQENAELNGEEIPAGTKYFFKVRPGDTVENMLATAFQELGINPMEVPVQYRPRTNWLPWILVALLMYRFGTVARNFVNTQSGQGLNIFKMGAANPLIVESPSGGVRFDDVAGMKEAKEEIKEFVDYLKSPKRFTALGARIPKGAILTGPPGTGKTLLAKAVSSEAGVPFMAMAGSDFVEMIGGVGAARVRSLFQQAKRSAPCIIFIDEVDAVGRKRSDAGSDNREADQTLNQLLVEMDGMEKLEGVVVMASTNRVDILDKALLRPGRFDRKIEIVLPTKIERMEIFETHLKKLPLEDSGSVYAKRLASLTPGHSGADIANICNEAALHAGRLNQTVVKSANFEYAIERIVAGTEKKSMSVPQDERDRSASYEAGRCVTAWLLEHCPPPLKTSILPRTTSALGYTQFAPLSEYLLTQERLLDRLCALVGGRAAEVVLYGSLSSLGTRHLKQATKLAEQLILEFGMGESAGQIAFELDSSQEKPIISNHLRSEVDKEIRQLLQSANTRAVSLLQGNEPLLKQFTASLKEKEVLNYPEIKAILGPPPHSKESFLEF